MAGSSTARNPPAATRSISVTASPMSVSGMGAVGRQAVEVRREPLDHVVVVDAGVGDRHLVVVGEQPELRQVRVQHLGVDAVDVHVLEDDLGIALGRAPAASGGSARRSSPRSRGCAACGTPGRRPRRRARSRTPPPTRPCRGGARAGGSLNRSIGSRRCPSAETTKSFCVMRRPPLRRPWLESVHARPETSFSGCANPRREARPTGRYIATVGARVDTADATRGSDA